MDNIVPLADSRLVKANTGQDLWSSARARFGRETLEKKASMSV
jgi:hypothetical protein